MQLIDLIRHLDKYLPQYAHDHGPLVYVLLFAIVFCETGVVIFPFLPGDSLLFASGAVGAAGGMSIPTLYVLFLVAAFLGDNTNYWIGRTLGRRLFQSETSKVFKKENLTRTEAFFAKYGPKAIIMARFVPVVRTFAPFVAGMGQMPYVRFLTWSVAASLLWVGVCVTAGILLGSQPFVKGHFDLIIVAVILVSLIPMGIEYLIHRRSASTAKTPESTGNR